ncbi:EcoRII N-terminal effector-binding domain-containing protein [Caproiciproducens sp. R2]|uniref:EcoRII N-terminal effector-binding domain-containing protein n=1 Tax=Caproiciproducens sp. R2 TaxID=3435187 RepID=UPI004034E9E0
MSNRPKSITKNLSLNDTGETGGHQAGMLIPKGGDVLRFFPTLGKDEKNPRTSMYFYDENGKAWKLNFIYYNGKFYGGTRNEYRLTGMTAFFRENGLKAGDTITLTHENDNDVICYKRQAQPVVKEIHNEKGQINKRIVLGSSWKVIHY